MMQTGFDESCSRCTLTFKLSLERILVIVIIFGLDTYR